MKPKLLSLILFFASFKIALFAQSKYPIETITLESGQTLEMVILREKGFSIGTTEVTQEFYEAVVGGNPSHYAAENNPVECVTWYDALSFCNRLSILTGRKPVYTVDGETNPEEWDIGLDSSIEQDLKADGFRLPTEEEWIYAAKGGSDFQYAGSNNLDEVGWYNKNSNHLSNEVKSKNPNGYGIYDMSGNVWEWCWDSYRKNSRHKILKGGSLNSAKELCTIKFQGHMYPSRSQQNYSYFSFGFRIASSKL